MLIVAQSAEQLVVTHHVVGSNPTYQPIYVPLCQWIDINASNVAMGVRISRGTPFSEAGLAERLGNNFVSCTTQFRVLQPAPSCSVA